MARFTATHGVSFHDLKIRFEFDRAATGNSQHKVYSADLNATDAKKLKAVDGKVLDEYGIREDKASKSTDANDDKE